MDSSLKLTKAKNHMDAICDILKDYEEQIRQKTSLAEELQKTLHHIGDIIKYKDETIEKMVAMTTNKENKPKHIIPSFQKKDEEVFRKLANNVWTIAKNMKKNSDDSNTLKSISTCLHYYISNNDISWYANTSDPIERRDYEKKE